MTRNKYKRYLDFIWAKSWSDVHPPNPFKNKEIQGSLVASWRRSCVSYKSWSKIVNRRWSSTIKRWANL